MISLIEKSKPALAELCRRFEVRRLYLFGSGTSARFNANTSDLDFLVELADRQPTKSYADRYLGLAEALERLFGRHVDLVTERQKPNGCTTTLDRHTAGNELLSALILSLSLYADHRHRRRCLSKAVGHAFLSTTRRDAQRQDLLRASIHVDLRRQLDQCGGPTQLHSPDQI